VRINSAWSIKVNVVLLVDDHETDFEYEGSDNDEEDHNEGDPRSVTNLHIGQRSNVVRYFSM